MAYTGAILNNRYLLDGVAGEGGFATVFAARDLIMGRKVALKLLNREMVFDQDLLDRFQREAQAAGALDHPNILPIFDMNISAEMAYIVMPYIQNGTLFSRLKKSPLSFEEAAHYLDQIANALDYAHDHNIIHRDIKPHNILLGSCNRAILTDFGFAKITQDPSVEAHTKIMGTVHYIAPEQLNGKVSAYTDQYALGVLLYQMLAGVVPFSGTQMAIIQNQLYDMPPPLSKQPTLQNHNPAIVDSIYNVICRAMSKNPTGRYHSCQALARAYREVIGNPITGSMGVVSRVPVGSTQQTELAPLIPSWPSVPAKSAPLTSPPRPAQRKPLMVRPPRLVVGSEPDQGVNPVFELTGEVLKLGRELNNELHVPLLIISRHHATFHRMGDATTGYNYRIVDNNSRNQLFINGKAVKEKILEDGDIIEIGKRGYGNYIVTLAYQAALFE